MKLMDWFKRLYIKYKHRKFCKLNRNYCPDCIYHEHIFDGILYRGIRCHYIDYNYPDYYNATKRKS